MCYACITKLMLNIFHVCNATATYQTGCLWWPVLACLPEEQQSPPTNYAGQAEQLETMCSYSNIMLYRYMDIQCNIH